MCFSMAWFEQLLILLVIVCAVIGILKILLPYVLKQLGAEASEGVGVIMAVVRIVIWAIIVIFVIYICFALIQCLIGYSGGMPLFPRGR